MSYPIVPVRDRFGGFLVHVGTFDLREWNCHRAIAPFDLDYDFPEIVRIIIQYAQHSKTLAWF